MGGAGETPDGGLMVRKHPQQPITNYIAVSSIDESAAKVKQLGGIICKSKTPIPTRLLRGVSGHGRQRMCAVEEERSRQVGEWGHREEHYDDASIYTI
jgi:hypothetical protein